MADADKQWSAAEVAQKADSEGLDYLILHWGLRPEQIADPELAKLWAEAKTALAGIEAILEPFMP